MDLDAISVLGNALINSVGSAPNNPLQICVHCSKYYLCLVVFAILQVASLAQLLPPHSPTWVILRWTALRAELLLPITSTSAAAPRLCLLQLLLSDCVCFNCSSPIASALTAAPRLHPPTVLEDISSCPTFLNSPDLRLCGVRGSVN